MLDEALARFGGTIVFISHDRYFINRIATKIVEVGGGALVPYLGNYDDYLTAKTRADVGGVAAGSARPRGVRISERHSSGRAPAASSEARRAGRARHPGGATRAVRELRRRLEEVEKQIHALEARIAEIGAALADPTLYTDGERARAVTAERKSAEEQVMWLMREWEELSTALAPHE